MKKLILLLFGCTILLITNPLKILACSCPTVVGMEEKVNWELQEAQAVFSGKVLNINRLAGSREVLVTFEINEFWKGVISNEISIRTDQSTGACGFPFQKGLNYLVFAYKSEKNIILSTGLCVADGEISKAAEQLKILGAGKIPEKNKFRNVRRHKKVRKIS